MNSKVDLNLFDGYGFTGRKCVDGKPDDGKMWNGGVKLTYAAVE